MTMKNTRALLYARSTTLYGNSEYHHQITKILLFVPKSREMGHIICLKHDDKTSIVIAMDIPSYQLQRRPLQPCKTTCHMPNVCIILSWCMNNLWIIDDMPLYKTYNVNIICSLFSLHTKWWVFVAQLTKILCLIHPRLANKNPMYISKKFIRISIVP